MIIKRLRLFSLEEGKFTGNKFSAKRTYISQAALGTALGAGLGGVAGNKKGALIGAGIGLISGLLTAALTRSVFNRSLKNNITTKNLFKEFSKIVDYFEKNNRSSDKKALIVNTEQYNLDSKNANTFDLSVKANEDSIVMYIRPLSKSEIDKVSDILDDYCRSSKNTEYISEKLENNDWIVTMNLVDYKDASDLLFELMSECNFRINFITR